MLGFIVCGIGLRARSRWARCAAWPARISDSILALAMTASGTVWAQTRYSEISSPGTSRRGLRPPSWQNHPTTRFAMATA
jgi:hypothetical protein